MQEITVDRNQLEVLDLAECLDLLASEQVGRIAYVERGRPVIIPVNHVMLGSTVALRTAAGGKLDTAIMGRPVAFEVDGHDLTTRTGWSVVVQGTTDVVEDESRLAWLGTQDLRPWADLTDAVWISIRADEVSGRRILRDRAPSAGDE